MRLNEAIREGCRTTKQVYGRFAIRSRGGASGACVVGALALGSGVASLRIGETFRQDWLAGIAYDFSAAATCPVADCCKKDPDRLVHVLIHLNDAHRWTREAIAEWADPRPELHVPMPTQPKRQHQPAGR